MRYYLGIGPQGPSVLYNVRMDETGEPMILLDEGATKKVRVNFADWLDAGETITAATAATSSCTASTTVSSPNVDITLSNATSAYYGSVVLLATSSSGEVYRLTIRVRRTGRYMDEQRYRRDYA